MVKFTIKPIKEYFASKEKEAPKQSTTENNEKMVNSLDEFLEDDELK